MIAPNPCGKCGERPVIKSARVAEDMMAAWVVCGCGNTGDMAEDVYVTESTRDDAVALWNEENPPAPGGAA